MDIHDYVLFEKCVVDIFSEAGYSVHRNVMIPNTSCSVDFVAELDGAIHCVEVKYSSITDRAAEKIYDMSETMGATPVLVTAYELGAKRAR